MLLQLSGDDVVLQLPGLLTLRAEFLAEGYYAEDAEGDPPEQDLFQVEVSSPHPAVGFEPFTYPLLLPSVAVTTGGDSEAHEPLRWARQYLLTLAPLLQAAPPAAWERICEASRTWGPDELAVGSGLEEES